MNRPVFKPLYDIIISPITWLNEINEYKQKHPFFTPVIAFGQKSQLAEAFLCGIADYIKEPWSMEELEFRILNLFKHRKIEFMKKEFFIEKNKISIGNQSCDISHREYLFLRMLWLNYGNLVHKNIIKQAVWGNIKISSKALDMLIMRLRKKIDKISGNGKKIICTVKPIGYMIPDTYGQPGLL